MAASCWGSDLILLTFTKRVDSQGKVWKKEYMDIILNILHRLTDTKKTSPVCCVDMHSLRDMHDLHKRCKPLNSQTNKRHQRGCGTSHSIPNEKLQKNTQANHIRYKCIFFVNKYYLSMRNYQIMQIKRISMFSISKFINIWLQPTL